MWLKRRKILSNLPRSWEWAFSLPSMYSKLYPSHILIIPCLSGHSGVSEPWLCLTNMRPVIGNPASEHAGPWCPFGPGGPGGPCNVKHFCGYSRYLEVAGDPIVNKPEEAIQARAGYFTYLWSLQTRQAGVSCMQRGYRKHRKKINWLDGIITKFSV